MVCLRLILFLFQNERIMKRQNVMKQMQKLYLDDLRPIPQGFVGVRSYTQFVA